MSEEVVNEIAVVLGKIDITLGKLAKITGITEWLMFAVSLVIALFAIVTAFVQSGKSSSAVAKIETLATRITEDNKGVIAKLFDMVERVLADNILRCAPTGVVRQF